MPILQIRDLPEDVCRRLRERAKREHRSLAQQATVLLQYALNQPVEPKIRRQLLLADLSRTAKGTLGRFRISPERLIREDRER